LVGLATQADDVYFFNGPDDGSFYLYTKAFLRGKAAKDITAQDIVQRFSKTPEAAEIISGDIWIQWPIETGAELTALLLLKPTKR
jgi:hypothetical protein